MNNSTKPLEPAVAARIPGATYRLQFNDHFTFDDAVGIVPYLADLGVTDCYASPLFQAGPRSTHGYDVCQFDQFSAPLGGLPGFERFAARLHEARLGLLLDMVPNHMGNDLSNRWWLDVLEHGRNSPFALFFDIDWEPRFPSLADKVLLPTLGQRYDQVLQRAQLRLGYDSGRFYIAYYGKQFPVAPRTYPLILERVAARCRPEAKPPKLASDVADYAEELSRRYAQFEPVPAESEQVFEQLSRWHKLSPEFRVALEETLREFHGRPEDPASFDLLHALLSRQHYRLASWRVGPEEINYRRFFDVSSLVSLRMELPLVFQAAHQLVLTLLRDGKVTGLRIDHPDGLWDPKEYFRRLQASYLATSPTDESPEARDAAISGWLTEQLFPLEQQLAHEPIERGLGHKPEAPRSDPQARQAPRPRWPLYVVAEKILSPGEPLRLDWPVEGTTGYDFLNQVNRLFVQPASREAFDRIYREFTGHQARFEDLVYLAKRQILQTSLRSEWGALAWRMKTLAAQCRSGQDFTLSQLRTAVLELISTFPVYRTYLTPDARELPPVERHFVERAVAEAKRRNPGLDPAVLDFVQDLYRLQWPRDLKDPEPARDFIMRFQQLSGPVMAKGLEDTAFYRFNRLISLNDVGGEPGAFGSGVDTFHQENLARARHWPHTLLATATHDTKRGEDVRARINVLSELPDAWQAALQRWSRLNAPRKAALDDQLAPDANDEYLLYQTLLGAWPALAPGANFDREAFTNRIVAYMAKATREAKVHTSWTDPNADYEKAVENFVRGALDSKLSRAFLDDFATLQHQIAFFGQFNSLAQTLLKLTAPGVPDFYQGTELWDLSLVDPDNRRPVNYDERREALDRLKRRSAESTGNLGGLLSDLLAHSHTGEIKLYLTWRALASRQKRQNLFAHGDYLPLLAAGPKADHVCAFARHRDRDAAITVVPRLVAGLTGGKLEPPMGESVWGTTTIALPAGTLAGSYRNVFTGEQETVSPESKSLRVSDTLARFPVALLEREST